MPSLTWPTGRAMSEFQFAIEWGALERLQLLLAVSALGENLRVSRLLFACQERAITALEFVERVRGAVPDPLAE